MIHSREEGAWGLGVRVYLFYFLGGLGGGAIPKKYT